jgi:hypothetical protein
MSIAVKKLVLGIGFSFLVLYNVWSAIDSPSLRLELIKEYMEFKLGLSLYVYYHSMAMQPTWQSFRQWLPNIFIPENTPHHRILIANDYQ